MVHIWSLPSSPPSLNSHGPSKTPLSLACERGVHTLELALPGTFLRTITEKSRIVAKTGKSLRIYIQNAIFMNTAPDHYHHSKKNGSHCNHPVDTIDLVIPTNGDAPLSEKEGQDLKTQETIIAAGLTTFFEVGAALMRIKDSRLYRGDFSTFEQYCRVRWEFSRRYAYHVLRATEVRALLAPINGTALPENERQIRPLVSLPKKLVKIAWIKASELAAGKKITGSLVAKAAQIVTKGKFKQRARKEIWQLDLQKLLGQALRQCRS